MNRWRPGEFREVKTLWCGDGECVSPCFCCLLIPQDLHHQEGAPLETGHTCIVSLWAITCSKASSLGVGDTDHGGAVSVAGEGLCGNVHFPLGFAVNLKLLEI